MEQTRHCGWLGLGESTKLIWARRTVSLFTCPKSYITGESLALLDDFFSQRRLGRSDVEYMTARHADAFLVLEDAMAMEMTDGPRDSRNAF
jgi:hypothetical protein